MNAFRKTVVAAATVALAGWGTGGQATAGESVSTAVSMDWVTHYVWRGMRLTDNPVLQPSVTVSAGGLSLNAWGSVDLTDVNEDDGESLHLQEVDYTASYGFSPVEGLDLMAGFIWYTFSGLDSTGEVFASVGLSAVPLSPTVSVYYDIDEAEGLYANASVKHAFDITEKLNLTLSGGVGWGDAEYHEFYFGDEAHGSFSELLAKATLNYALTDSLSAYLYGGYTELLDREVDELAKAVYGDSDVLFGGVGLAFSF